MSKALVLFHRDLRLHDHPALEAAKKTGKSIVYLYVDDEVRPLGRNSQKHLENALGSLHPDLIVHKGDLIEQVMKVALGTGADELFWIRSYEPARAKKLETLAQQKIKTHDFQGNLLMDPTGIKPYQVYSPFWKRCLQVLDPPKPKVKKETKGQNTLYNFVENRLENYPKDRDVLDADTSRLSAYLHFGEISVNEVWYAVNESTASEEAKICFMREIGFREFSYHLLHHFPRLPEQNFRGQFDRFQWQENSNYFEKWKEGKTGYPVVDAGMRQLKETGWMHNRARMIVASFLTKDLLIHWKRGEEWFWEFLEDADHALNAFNWQRTAGSGADAAPYFRIFNPTLQQKKFDPNFQYVRRWVPEFGTLDYPMPMIDHAAAKKQALEYYEKVKK